jgi:hypothetical protein
MVNLLLIKNNHAYPLTNRGGLVSVFYKYEPPSNEFRRNEKPS